MSLQAFRELLLKKTAGNNILSTFVEYIGENFLADAALEALEKMARPTNYKGLKANPAVTTYASHLDKSDVAQLRDALSHHVSHYKAALKAHHAATDRAEKQRLRTVADQHLNHLIPLMDLAAKASAHSGGRLAIDYTRLPAWETNYTTLDRRPETGKFVHDTMKLRRRPAAGARVWSPDAPNNRGVRDYYYLEMPPHPGHKDVASMDHEGGYPWEEILLGSESDVDNKQAYLHIDDIPNKSEYTPHPFDEHPIRQVQDIYAHHFSDDRLKQFAEDLSNWKSSDHHRQWLASQKEAFARDPEGYKQRGKIKPSHVYEGIPLQEQLGHIHNHPKVTRPKEAASNLEDTRAKIAQLRESLGVDDEDVPAPPSVPAATPVVRKRSAGGTKEPSAGVLEARNKIAELRRQFGLADDEDSTPAQPSTPTPAPAPVQPATPTTPAAQPHPMDIPYKHYISLADDHPMKAIYHGNPDFMNYLKTKKGGQE